MKGTGGTETSKYLEEKKVNNDCGSSGERIRNSPNLLGFCLLTQTDKLVDEDLKGVVTLQTIHADRWFYTSDLYGCLCYHEQA